MKEMNVDVVRVYTILDPEFYHAFRDFNSTWKDPLWLIQGVWSPEEELIGTDQEGRDAYDPKTTAPFRQELRDAARVVHGATPTCRSALDTPAGGSAPTSPSTCSVG
jgi:hypothetical protein